MVTARSRGPDLSSAVAVSATGTGVSLEKEAIPWSFRTLGPVFDPAQGR